MKIIPLQINRDCGESKGEEWCEGKKECDSGGETNDPSFEKLLCGNCVGLKNEEMKETNTSTAGRLNRAKPAHTQETLIITHVCDARYM